MRAHIRSACIFWTSCPPLPPPTMDAVFADVDFDAAVNILAEHTGSSPRNDWWGKGHMSKKMNPPYYSFSLLTLLFFPHMKRVHLSTRPSPYFRYDNKIPFSYYTALAELILTKEHFYILSPLLYFVPNCTTRQTICWADEGRHRQCTPKDLAGSAEKEKKAKRHPWGDR